MDSALERRSTERVQVGDGPGHSAAISLSTNATHNPTRKLTIHISANVPGIHVDGRCAVVRGVDVKNIDGRPLWIGGRLAQHCVRIYNDCAEQNQH
jgi:hypothetical protein